MNSSIHCVTFIPYFPDNISHDVVVMIEILQVFLGGGIRCIFGLCLCTRTSFYTHSAMPFARTIVIIELLFL